MNRYTSLKFLCFAILAMLVAAAVSACNLSTSLEGAEELTQEATFSVPPTRTPQGTFTGPTPLPLNSAPTTQAGTFPNQGLPTSVLNLPTPVIVPQQPQNTVPTSIVILSPIPGNVVAGNVQVLGSAIHPNFLQYQLEYGPDPNPGNLWYPATGAVQTPVLNNLLGIWNTTAVQDGTYQLRLRVFLRDASSLTSVVNNIRVQNRQPTPQPSPTPNKPRPIAAFNVDRSTGQAPLEVRFVNQSQGEITSYQWNLGDGTTSSQQNTRHTFTSPGLYTVTLTVTGPGGTSNVSSQINVQSPSAPVAGFAVDRASGPSPLTVQFTDQSTGTVTSYHWNFSDGTGSTERNPQHVFTVPGSYNVFLTVIGPGGSSSTRREITVLGPTQTALPTLSASIVPLPSNTPTSTATTQPTEVAQVPTNTPVPSATPLPTEVAQVPTNTPVPSATPLPTETMAPSPTPLSAPTASFTSSLEGNLTVRFVDQSTSTAPGGITAWQWNFGDGTTSSEQNPLHQFPAAGTYTVQLTVTDAGGSNSTTNNVEVPAPLSPPMASFTTVPMGNLTAQFLDTSTSTAPGGITSRLWNFGDGTTSSEQNPVHQFPAGGTYTVELTVTDAGGSHTTATAVEIAAPVQPPTASFTSQPAGDLAVQFVDQSTSTAPGGITAWAWNFGDGTTSSEQNPLHLFPAGGTYTVELTVTDAGGSNTTSNTVEVAAPEVAPPPQQDAGIVGQTTVLPDLNDQELRNNIRSIYEQGQTMGNRGTVFAVAGDATVMDGGYLDPFRTAGSYQLDDSTAYLQGTIDWFNQVDLNGQTSFNRTSVATGGDWKINALLNPERANASVCEPGESPLACELRLTQPAVVIISVGSADINDDTEIDRFRERLAEVIRTATSKGVIPVLTTVQPRPDQFERTRAVNEAIIEVADQHNVPVYNLWARLTGLPNNGLNGDNQTLSQAPGGPADLSAGAVAQYGLNARNLDTLVLLEMLHSQIFPDFGAFAAGA